MNESLLETLMRDTLDPGYAEAARRRAQAPPSHEAAAQAQVRRRRRHEQLLSAGGAALVGLLLVVAWMQTDRSAPTDARVRSDLRNRVVSAEHDNAALVTSVRSMQSSVDALGSAALGPGDTNRLRAAELAAGATAVQGEGLRVVLDNPPLPTSPSATAQRGAAATSSVSALTDTDVRAVVNQLWSSGAEAIAVNDVRLTPTSAIRFAGQAVLVDFRPVSAPYTISAIGPADALNTDLTTSPIADRLRTLSSAYGFVFSVSQSSAVRLPASTGGGPKYAHTGAATPTGGATSTPGATPTAAPTS